jgi:N-acyl homoserine lactone hydrolase
LGKINEEANPMAKPPMKVYIQHHGNMMCDYRWLLVNADWMQSKSNPEPQSHRGPCPTHTVVVDHPDGRLLFDTTCPRDWQQHWANTVAKDWFPYEDVAPEQYFEERLQQLKLDPSDFKYVALSHLHLDHAGNIKAFQRTDAQILVHKKEYQGAMSIPGEVQGFHLKKDYLLSDLRWVQLSEDTEIMEGVHLIETPGHTWGTMCLQVDLPHTGTMIFTSDAAYMRDSYGPPPIGASIVWDSLGWLNSIERIRGIANTHNATIIFGHDPKQIKEIRLAPEAFYD